jgi:hypothetical protein
MARKKLARPLAPATAWRWRLRQLRNSMVLVAVVVTVAHTVGLPHLRWEYGFRGSRDAPLIDWGLYAGPNGLVRIEAWERPEACPHVLFLKPSRPLWGLLGERPENQP